MSMRVLVVEDEAPIREMLVFHAGNRKDMNQLRRQILLRPQRW